MRHAIVGPVDRLTDVASTVQGPLSVRRSQFDALAGRLLGQRALTSVALARSTGGRAPARSGADDAPGRPGRFAIVYSSSRGKADPTREAVQQSAGRAALQGAIRSGETRATQTLPAVGGSPPSIAVAVPVRAAGSGVSGAFLTSFSARDVRAAVATHLPKSTRVAVVQSGESLAGLRNPLRRRVRARRPRVDASPSSSPRRARGSRSPRCSSAACSTILIAVVGSQSMRRERDALGLIAIRRAERDRAELARLEAEARSRVLAETSTDLICVLEPDGAVRYASPACRDLLGLEPEQLLGRAFTDLVHADDAAGVAAVLGARRAEEAPVSITHRMRRAAGTVWVETRLRVVRDPATGAVVESHATVRDVAERMQSQAALAEAEERFRSAFEEAPIGMALTSPDFRFLRVNRALCQITGYTPAQLEGLPVASITHPDDLKADWEARGAMLEGELSGHRAERRYLHASGSAVWVAINSTLVRDADGKPLHFLSQMQDITERRRHEAELRHMADHDPLTGLLNRRSFERELERHVAYVERYGPKGAAIVLDLDHFKTINDTLGHSAGDELIVRVAHALRSRLRESDVLARLGGDEFAILLPEATPEEADAVAAAVLDSVRTLAVPTATGRTRTVTASLGIALFDSAPADDGRGRARQRRPRDVRRQGGRARPARRLRRARAARDADRGAHLVGGHDPRRARRGPLRPARAADHRPRDRRGDPVRAAAAHARRRRRADRPVRLPPRRRALRPDGGDRPLGRRARDPHGRRRAAPRPPAGRRGQHLRPLRRRPGAARADRAASCARARSARARSSSRSPRRSRSPTSRAPSTSRPASPTSAAASRSTTSAPASAPSTTSSTCRSTTSRSTASSSATRPPTRRTSS